MTLECLGVGVRNLSALRDRVDGHGIGFRVFLLKQKTG